MARKKLCERKPSYARENFFAVYAGEWTGVIRGSVCSACGHEIYRVLRNDKKAILIWP